MQFLELMIDQAYCFLQNLMPSFLHLTFSIYVKVHTVHFLYQYLKLSSVALAYFWLGFWILKLICVFNSLNLTESILLTILTSEMFSVIVNNFFMSWDKYQYILHGDLMEKSQVFDEEEIFFTFRNNFNHNKFIFG